MICIVSLNEYGVSFAHLLILFLRPIQQFLSIPSRTELSGNIMVRRDHKRDFWFGVVFGVVLFMGRGECAPSTQQQSRGENCPEVKPMKDFDIFKILGPWYVVQYYSSPEEALTYHCMRTTFELSNGNMDMRMKIIYKYVADPNDEMQTGNITWQIPDPMRPGHWRHTEDHYKGVYNTDVVDTDHSSWLILLHCSDPEEEKKFLSTFVLSRVPFVTRLMMDYLREKVTAYDVNSNYLFPVNQTFCFGENGGVGEGEGERRKTKKLSYDELFNNSNEEDEDDEENGGRDDVEEDFKSSTSKSDLFFEGENDGGIS